MIDLMEKLKETMAALAGNLNYFMGLRGIKNANQLHLKTNGKVSANAIRHYLGTTKRPDYTHTKKDAPAPTLDKLVLLANALKCDPWELLHPDIEKARRDQETLKVIDARYQPDPPRPPSLPKEASFPVRKRGLRKKA